MDEELYLTDVISVDILQQLQNAFSEMTGMAAVTTDAYGVPITEPSNFSEFCMKYTRQTPLGNSRCMRCDKMGAELTMNSGRACTYYCHAGLVDFAAPILFKDKMIGSFIGGQVLPTPPNMNQIEKTAIELGINPVEYKIAASKVKILDSEQIRKSAESLAAIANAFSYMAYQSLELYRSNLEIEKASHMKSDFLANMSHEIRTPMNAVIGMVDLALREEMPPNAKNYVHQIKSSAKNLLVIINDILDFSKIESGKMDIINVAYEPLSLINDLASIANSRIGNKNIEFTIDVSPDMPQLIFGDNVRIHQILLNLVTNAIKFTKQGEVHLKFECVQAEEGMVNLKVSVSDTGMGIKEENFQKLFNSFQQVDSKRNRNIEGTGLGLAISKQLLSLMDGKISVESEYGKGSNFFFELPQRIIDDTPAIPMLNKNSKTGIIISNEYVRKQLIRDLNRIGAEPVMLDDVALSEIDDFEYIIMERDFYSHEMEERLKKAPNTQCIIVIANYDAPNDIESPNVKIIHKPVYSLTLYNAMGISNYVIAENKEIDSFTFVAPDARILIVDDNSTNLTVAKGLIEPINMIVDTAESASVAIELASRTKYDLIFMDHMMPEVDGIEATHIIRRMLPSYSDTPIIALTANAVGGAREMFIKEGMNDFVAKPIEVKDIISKLRKWLPQDKILPANKVEGNEESSERKLVDIPELNVENAISMLGSEKLYLSVLKEYYSSIDKKAGSIQSHYCREEWKEYTIEVHALKSTSRQIGADDVGELAAELEQAGKDNNIELIREKTQHLLDEYMRFKKILAPIFAEEETEANTEHADNNIMLSLISKIDEALENYDILQIDDVIAEMDGYEYDERYQPIFNNLKKAAENSDIDKCLEIAAQWREEINSVPSSGSNDISDKTVLNMLENLQDALNNFDILKIDEEVESLGKYKYANAYQEYYEQLKEYAEQSDIDRCCEIVAKWRAVIIG